jgi:vacuolar-type H+-ATPase subunit I/STV1
MCIARCYTCLSFLGSSVHFQNFSIFRTTGTHQLSRVVGQALRRLYSDLQWGGVAAVVYEFITHRRLSKKHGNKKVEHKRVAVCVALLIGVFVFIFGFTNSFVATILSLGCVTVFILWQRKDLVWDSVVSAVALVLIGQFVYALLAFLTPGWVEAFFYFHNVPYMYVGALPIDDFFWYLAAGAAISPMYEYCSSRRFVNGV